MNTFFKRPGCTDRGKDYEDFLTGLLALKLTLNDKVKDFKLSANDNRYGNLDDIVVEIINHKQKIEKYLIQLKHKQNVKRRVKIGMLEQSEGDFSIKKYFQTFKKLGNPNLRCILYTNTKFEYSPNLRHSNIAVIKKRTHGSDFIKTSECGYVYKFVSQAGNPSVTDEYNNFLKRFCFYSNQKNVDEIKRLLSQLLKTKYNFNTEAVETYLEFIRNWSLTEGEKYCLNKKIIKLKIGEILLKPSCLQITLNAQQDEKCLLLQEAYLQYDFTILTTNEPIVFNKITNIFSQPPKINSKAVSQIVKQFVITSKLNSSLDDLEPEEKTLLLWHMNKIPLVVRVNEENAKTIEGAIKLFIDKSGSKRKFVLVGKGIDFHILNNVKVLRNLVDLSSVSNYYNQILRNFTILLQGREEVTLKSLVQVDEEITKAITTVELMKMLDGPLIVGEDRNQLPDPYIDQLLPRILIDFRFLTDDNVNSLPVLSCNNKLENIQNQLGHCKQVVIRDFLERQRKKSKKERKKSKKKIVMIAENQCSEKQFQKICKTSSNKICHHFRINHNENLEWVGSNGSVEELKKYRLNEDCLQQSEMIRSSVNKINIISAKPGGGKTLLLKCLQKHVSAVHWIIEVNVEEHLEEIKKKQNCLDILNDSLLKQEQKNNYDNFTIKIREIFKAKKKVVILWDSLDRLSKSDQTVAIKTIEDLADLGFINWVTARDFLQSFLENKWNILAFNIKELDQKQREVYIRNRLQSACPNLDLDAVIEKITEVNGVIENSTFLGLPLHLNIMTKHFQNPDQCEKLLKGAFTLPELIRCSIEEQIDFCFKPVYKFENRLLLFKLSSYREKLIREYEKLALKTFLPNWGINHLQINCDKFLDDIKRKNDYLGIIAVINEGNHGAIFVQNLYGEYFVASWMAKHTSKVSGFRDFIFEEIYNNIRKIFDLILAEGCPAHLAVLHKNLPNLRTNEEATELKDIARRNVLHIASSWCQKQRTLSIEEEHEDVRILRYLIEHRACNPFEVDALFQWTSVCYADRAHSLLAIELIFCSHEMNLQNYDDVSDCLYSDACYYIEILTNVERDLNVNDISTYGLVHRAPGGGKLRIVEIKTKHDVNINSLNNDGRRPLYFTIENEHIIEMVRNLGSQNGRHVNGLDNEHGIIQSVLDDGNI